VAGFLSLIAALAGFGLGFALVWATLLDPLAALAGGLLLGLFFYRWTRGLIARGPSPAALRAWALTLARRKGKITPEALAKASGGDLGQARKTLETLAQDGLLAADEDGYRLT